MEILNRNLKIPTKPTTIQIEYDLKGLGIALDEAVVSFQELGNILGGINFKYSQGGYISNTISTKPM